MYQRTRRKQGATQGTGTSSSSLTLPPEFIQDPSAYLMAVATEPPSQEALRKLAGPVASWFSNPNSAQAATSHVASLYLKAVANQLKLEVAGSSSVAAARKATRHGRMEEMEMMHIQNRAEVIEVSDCLSVYLLHYNEIV